MTSSPIEYAVDQTGTDYERPMKPFSMKSQTNWTDNARTYLQTTLPLPEFFPIGQWNRFK